MLPPRLQLQLQLQAATLLLTDAEAALYDRQLRVWGVEGQQR